MAKWWHRGLLAAAGALASAAFAESLEPVESVESVESELTLEAAWVRALPPTQNMTAAYLTVRNPGSREVVLNGASAELAEGVEIHETREADGLVGMRRLSELRVGPGQTLALEPGGVHLMLLNLRHMPQPGDTLRLCLQLAPGGETCTVATVRKSAAAAAGVHSHKHRHRAAD